MNFIFNLLPDNLRSAVVLGIARHVAGAVSGALLTWLLAKGADKETAQALVSQIAAAIPLAAAVGLSIYDKLRVGKKLSGTPQTGKVAK